jgi:hypothetical protein
MQDILAEIRIQIARLEGRQQALFDHISELKEIESRIVGSPDPDPDPAHTIRSEAAKKRWAKRKRAAASPAKPVPAPAARVNVMPAQQGPQS